MNWNSSPDSKPQRGEERSNPGTALFSSEPVAQSSEHSEEIEPRKGQRMTDDVLRRGSYVSPSHGSSPADRRRQRRRQRRMERRYRPESRLVTRLKQVALALFIAAGIAVIIYGLFIYE